MSINHMNEILTINTNSTMLREECSVELVAGTKSSVTDSGYPIWHSLPDAC